MADEIGRLVGDTKPDHVIHLAGLLMEPCEVDPQHGFRISVMATLALLEACHTHGVGRFVMTNKQHVRVRQRPDRTGAGPCREATKHDIRADQGSV